MTLEDLVKKVVKLDKDGKRKVSDTYAPGALIDLYDGLTELDSTDIYTSEGLEKYRTLTGKDPSKISQEEVEYFKEAWSKTGNSDLLLYANAHFGKLVGEIREEGRRAIGLKYTPLSDVPGEENSEYNSSRRVVVEAKETIEAIKKDSKSYFNKKLEEQSPLLKDYMVRFPDRYLEIKRNEAIRGASFAIARFGSEKYLEKTKSHLETKTKEFDVKSKELNERINEKIESLEPTEGRLVPTSMEIARAIASEQSELRKLNEDYKDTQELPSLVNDTIGYAIAAIREKTAEEEKKKAEEAKEKTVKKKSSKKSGKKKKKK